MGPNQPDPAETPVTPSTDSPAPVTTPVAPSGPVVNGQQAVAPVAGSTPTGDAKGRKRWLLPAAVVAAVVVLGGGYVFGLYLPNQPDAVYSTGLKNSGKAVDKLIDYADGQTTKNYKSADVKGTVTVKSAGASFDTSISGSFNKDGSGTATVAADVLGQKLNLNVLSVHVAASTPPDLYLKVSGVKSFLDSYGLNSLDSLDGQWIAVDHTLLDTYAQGLVRDSTGAKASVTTPTTDEIIDAANKVQAVNKQYVFTTNSGTAVLKENKYVGKETKDSRSAYHYKVGYDKTHLTAYVGALKTALDSSKLNDWSKKANGKSLSEVLSLTDLTNQVKTLSGNGTVDVWVDAKTKLIQSIQVIDPSDKNSSFTIAQDYTGGDSYPLTFTTDSKDGSGAKQHFVVGLVLNTATNVATVSVNGTADSTVVTAHLTITPGNKAVNTVAPSGSKPITDLLGQLGLGGLSGPSASSNPYGNVSSNLFNL